MSIFNKDLLPLCDECQLDKKEVVKTIISLLCMVAIISLMGWSIVDKYSAQPTPLYIDKSYLKEATAAQLAQYTHDLNAELERRLKK